MIDYALICWWHSLVGAGDMTTYERLTATWHGRSAPPSRQWFSEQWMAIVPEYNLHVAEIERKLNTGEPVTKQELQRYPCLPKDDRWEGVYLQEGVD